jgi:hypothetical protein
MSSANSTAPADRMRALARANEIRLARAQLKRRIAHGELSAAQIILAPPREAGSWPLIELLISQRHWGTTKCRRFLARTQIDERKPIGRLTDRQRRLLAAQLALTGSRHLEADEPGTALHAPERAR